MISMGQKEFYVQLICWTFYSSRNPEHNVFHFQINHNCF